jgi:hypothetical protein
MFSSVTHIRIRTSPTFYTRRTIIALRSPNTVPRRSFLFYLDKASWFDASGPDAQQHLEALALRIANLVFSHSVPVSGVEVSAKRPQAVSFS